MLLYSRCRNSLKVSCSTSWKRITRSSLYFQGPEMAALKKAEVGMTDSWTRKVEVFSLSMTSRRRAYLGNTIWEHGSMNLWGYMGGMGIRYTGNGGRGLFREGGSKVVEEKRKRAYRLLTPGPCHPPYQGLLNPRPAPTAHPEPVLYSLLTISKDRRRKV